MFNNDARQLNILKRNLNINPEPDTQQKNDENNLDKGLYDDPNMKSNFLIPEESRRFNKVLFNLNKQFYLTKNDYIKILKLVGYKGEMDDFTKNDIYQIFVY